MNLILASLSIKKKEHFITTTMTLPLTHPFTAIIGGPSRAGKSTFLAKLLKYKREMIEPHINQVYYCYSEWQPLFETKCFQGVQFHQGDISVDSIDPKQNNLVIYDDLLTQCNENMESMFTKYSHHRNTSVVFITQNIFAKNKHMRTMSLNASYFVLFKNPRDVNQIKYLSSQMYASKSQFLIEAFNDATAAAFGYLFIDLQQQTDDRFRIRTKIFPDEETYIYVPKHQIGTLNNSRLNKEDHE